MTYTNYILYCKLFLSPFPPFSTFSTFRKGGAKNRNFLGLPFPPFKKVEPKIVTFWVYLFHLSKRWSQKSKPFGITFSTFQKGGAKNRNFLGLPFPPFKKVEPKE